MFLTIEYQCQASHNNFDETWFFDLFECPRALIGKTEKEREMFKEERNDVWNGM